MLEKQVADVEREAHALLRKCGTYVLINRKLSAKADGVVVKDTECSRTEKNLMGLGVGDWRIRLEESVRTFSDQLTKESPIPFIWRSTPLLWAISVTTPSFPTFRRAPSTTTTNSAMPRTKA